MIEENFRESKGYLLKIKLFFHQLVVLSDIQLEHEKKGKKR